MCGTDLAKKVSEQFTTIINVEAITVGGSRTSSLIDAQSDIDLYIYTNKEIPVEKRGEIVNKLGASKANMNLTYWDTGDEWFDQETGLEVDVMYWSPTWIEEQLDRVLVRHQASMGYTTCFWRTVKNSKILFDRNDWFYKLQEKSNQPSPLELKRAIIAKNHPVLRNVIPAYTHQIKKALERNDLVSINHRLAALFASYFDVLFAINEVLHPGEKKILKFVNEECTLIPENLETLISLIFQSGAAGDLELLNELDALIDGLDKLLMIEGFHPEKN
jgi:predicted nucleotidyltransferase